MTLEELRTQFRSDVDDRQGPTFLFSDDDVTRWLNEAEEEAALRADLLQQTFDDIPVSVGIATYDLPDGVFRITKAIFTATGDAPEDAVELVLSDRIEQDRTRRGWRSRSEPPRAVIVDDTRLTLACLPDTTGALSLEGYRAPLDPMKNDGDTPEIGRAHHRFLPLWAAHRGFSRPDTEVFDPKRSETALAQFTAQFGQRPDAELGKNFEANAPAHNKAEW